MRLSKTERNDVFATITDAGLIPSEFTLGVTESKDHVLRHVPSRSHFRWGATDSFPGSELMLNIDARIELGERLAYHIPEDRWRSLLRSWVAELKQEVDAADLWAALEEHHDEIAAASDGDENTPFTAIERAEITKQLADVRTRVRGMPELSEGQKRVLEEHLDYFDEATGRLGRLDWRSLVYGVLLGDIVNAVLPAEVVRSVLMTVLQGVAHLFGHALPPLPAGL